MKTDCCDAPYIGEPWEYEGVQWARCSKCGEMSELWPHSDLDTIDEAHDRGLRDLTDPFTRDYIW